MFPTLATVLVLSLAAPAPAPQGERWIEVSSPSFTLLSDGNEKDARGIAWQFEQVRALLKRAWPWADLDPTPPIVILAVRNERGLRALLPDVWADKKAAHPNGVFVSSPDRNWVALRMDVAEVRQHDPIPSNPYEVVFHEYVHVALHTNFGQLPVWLDEGLAIFWGNTIVEKRSVYEGYPIPHHLETLRDNALIPLATLFAVTRRSSDYLEPLRARVFYAESWALAHYLIIGSDARRGQIDSFTEALAQGRAEAEAAHEAFGDPEALGRELTRYVRDYRVLRYDGPSGVDSEAFRRGSPGMLLRYGFRTRPRPVTTEVDAASFRARALPRAESLGLRALFHAARGRRPEALALAEESRATAQQMLSTAEEPDRLRMQALLVELATLSPPDLPDRPGPPRP